MAKERLFFTGSTNIICDARPSGLDLRVYACISLHDGMSLVKGTGRGCYATFATLTGEIGCDPANLSRSLRRLVDWGYLVEERQDDRRRKTYRVVFESAETWQNRQQSADEIVGNDESENRRNPLLTDQHYSSLKGLNTLEREKLNSSEEARFAARVAHQGEDDLPVGAQLAIIERKLGEPAPDCLALYERLGVLFDCADDNATRGWAMRLSEQAVEAMNEEEYRAWGTSHGWIDDDGKWHAPHPREDDGPIAAGGRA